jgi:uncharacterized membrane protein YfcA
MGDDLRLGSAIAAAAIVAIAGLVRGITGFGGSMVMTPPLSLLLGPSAAVVTALILETIAALQFLPEVVRKVRWRTLLPISVAAAITVPLGGYLLVTLDREIVRRLIAGVVVVFSLALLIGYRHTGRPRITTSVMLGLLSGVMLGTTGIGAPPIILYLLSGPDPAAVTRANLTTYVTVISIFGLVTFWASAVMTMQLVLRSLLLAPLFLGGMCLGSRVFAKMTDESFRRATLIVLIAISAIILVV